MTLDTGGTTFNEIAITMLTENDVVKKLSIYLEKNGYEIIQSLTTGERGVDIIAKKNGKILFIEAKGETSSKSVTYRFGSPFSKSQIKSHVSRAILAAMKILTAKPAGSNTIAALALPETDLHKELIKEIHLSIKKLDIKVFWVSQSRIRQE